MAMVRLGIRSPEQRKGHAPGESGLSLGLRQAPEGKTLRRRLREIGQWKLSRMHADSGAGRRVRAEPEALEHPFVDGHVRPYHGCGHRIARTFVQRRRLCMSASPVDNTCCTGN